MALRTENEIQQLNFALWCATTGSGISREIMHKLSQQLRAFYLFHVYFTVRRILFEMGGIQSFSALPGDPTFSQTENKYDSPSYKRICAKFGIDPNTDFRFVHGQNHGLGYCYVPGDPQPYKNWIYQLVLIIQVLRGFLMKEDQQHRPEINISEMNWITSPTNRVRIVSLIGLSPRKWKDSLRRGSHA